MLDIDALKKSRRPKAAAPYCAVGRRSLPHNQLVIRRQRSGEGDKMAKVLDVVRRAPEPGFPAPAIEGTCVTVDALHGTQESPTMKLVAILALAGGLITACHDARMAVPPEFADAPYLMKPCQLDRLFDEVAKLLGQGRAA